MLKTRHLLACSPSLLLFVLPGHAGQLARKGECATVRAHPVREYLDTSAGLSFEYPSTWILGSPPEYLVPDMLMDQQVAKASVYSRGGRAYRKTNLIGESFSYLRLPATGADACAARAQQNHGEMESVDSIEVQGARLMHGSTSEGATCHLISQEVYWVYRGRTCYLFETDLASVCADADVGNRALTEGDYQALRSRLLRIVKSIRFDTH